MGRAWDKQINQDGDTLADWAAESLNKIAIELWNIREGLDELLNFLEVPSHSLESTARNET